MSQAEAAEAALREEELVTAARGGDHEAFGKLFTATRRRIYNLALKMTGNHDDALDVVQETYLRAFRSLRRFNGKAKFSTWVHAIARNVAYSHLLRRNKHQYEEMPSDANVADERPEVDPFTMAEAEQSRVRLTAALANLPPRLRAVVVLRDVYDMEHQAIADELNISLEASKVRLHRARRKLRAVLFPLPGEFTKLGG